jgi:curved DNA-binding protein CbpA
MPHNIDNRIYTDLDYYAILEITAQATPADIRKNYIRLARQLHPDKIGQSASEEDNDRFKKVQTAFEILRDPNSRIMYDVYRRSQPRSTSSAARVSSAVRTQRPSKAVNQNRAYDPTTSPTANNLLMSKISQAALSKNIDRLKLLLAEYNRLKFADLYGEDNLKEFNWLLRTAAFEQANEVAKILIRFGADPNHYGPIIRKDNLDVIECYFAEMLVYCNNKELFKDLAPVFDFQNFVVTAQPRDNINNPKVNLNNLSYAQFNEYERNLDKEPNKAEARIFILNLNTRLFMLSMLCHWAIENDCAGVLQRIKAISHPRNHWHTYSGFGIASPEITEDRIRSCMLFHRYNSLYVIDNFERVANQSRAYLFKYYLQYFVDRLCLNSTLLLSKDSNAQYLEEIVKRFSILLEADKIDASGLIHRIEWQKKHHYKFLGLFGGSFMLGIILSLVATSLAKDNDSKSSLGIASLVLLAPFSVIALLPVALLLLRPFTCGLYDVYLTLDEAMLSAYTNLLLADRLKAGAAPVIVEPAPVVAPESCTKRAGRLFFCYGSTNREAEEQEADPENQLRERLLLTA